MDSFLKNKILIITLTLSISLVFSGCEIFPGVDINPIKEKDGGIFKSIDGGNTWQQKIKINEKDSIASKNILCFTVDSHNANIIYIGTRSDGIYKTIDGGETWFKLSDENKILSPKASVYDIAVDSKDSRYIYITLFQEDRGRVFKSSNEGKSWKEIYLSQAPEEIILDIEPDFFDTRILYLATSNGGFFKSANYGASWELKTFFERSIEKIILDTKDTRTLWVISGSQIYKSDNRGDNWQSFEKQLKDAESNSVLTSSAIDPSNSNCIYIGSSQGIFKTTNGGNSWFRVNVITSSQTIPILDIAISPNNSLIIYYAAGSVLYKSIDGGITWTIHNIRSGKIIRKISFDPNNPEIIYLSMSQSK